MERGAGIREFDLIAKIAERIGEPAAGRLKVGIGDDAAVTVPGGATAVSVDALVDGVHFTREHFPPAAIGRKALAAALSDLAAMGAEPGEAYTVLGIPPDLDEAGCLAIFGGIEAVAGETGTTLAGGDVTRSPVLSLAITVVGHAGEPEELIQRSGAQAGDVLAVTGELGGAAAGLLLLQRGELADAVATAVADRLVARQLDPSPRLKAGQALAGAGATALIDVSDGLTADALHVATASGVRLEIDAALLPVQEGVAEVAAADGADPVDMAASGGEDYELLVTLPQEKLADAAAAVEQAGTQLTKIGVAGPGEGITLTVAGEQRTPPPGFDHLA